METDQLDCSVGIRRERQTGGCHPFAGPRSLPAQGDDRIEAGRLPGWIESEEETDGGGDGDREDHRLHGEERRPTGVASDRFGREGAER